MKLPAIFDKFVIFGATNLWFMVFAQFYRWDRFDVLITEPVWNGTLELTFVENTKLWLKWPNLINQIAKRLNLEPLLHCFINQMTGKVVWVILITGTWTNGHDHMDMITYTWTHGLMDSLGEKKTISPRPSWSLGGRIRGGRIKVGTVTYFFF